MNIFRAIEIVAAGRAFECAGTYDSIVCHGWEKPTMAELEAASAQADAAEQLRLQLLAVFGTLPPGVQVAFKVTADAMRDAFARADIATARVILETTPVLPELEASKAALLAIFPNV